MRLTEILMRLEKEEKKEEKKKKDKKGKKWLIVLGSSALVVLILVVAYSRFSTLAEKYLAKQPPIGARVTGEFPKIVTVGKEWHRVSFPYCSWFEISPEAKIRIRLLYGRGEFEQLPTGELFHKGEKVPSLGDKIPGAALDIRAAADVPVKVVISVRKKI